jgi:AcrR family transcriptional regulator
VAVDPRAFRNQVHEQALDAAHRMLVEHGWDKLRFGEVATAVGVSRPTLYAAFGSKDGLAEALVLRETDRFLTGVAQELDRHGQDLRGAIEAAVAYTLAEAERSPVLHAVLTSARPGSESLLPLLTTRSQPVLDAATTVLSAWVAEEHPGAPEEEIRFGVDALVRLVVSHLVLPAPDESETPARLAELAVRYLELASTSSR